MSGGNGDSVDSDSDSDYGCGVRTRPRTGHSCVGGGDLNGLWG